MDDNTAKVLLAVLPATVTGLLTWHLTSRSQKLFYPQKWWERQAQAYDNIMGALGDLDLVLGEWEQYFTHQILLSEEYRADLF